MMRQPRKGRPPVANAAVSVGASMHQLFESVCGPSSETSSVTLGNLHTSDERLPELLFPTVMSSYRFVGLVVVPIILEHILVNTLYF